MKKYSSYQDSELEWIGEIPNHWNVVKTYILTENLDGKRIPLNSEQRSNMKGEIPYWGSNGVVDYVNDYIFDEAIVLVGEDGAPFFDRNKPVSFYVNEKVWVNNHIHILKPRNKITPKYITYSFNCVDYKEFITGSTRDKLTQTDLKTIPHSVPPLPEQKRIVEYLDEKTSKIDRLIQSKQQKIELLKEKRTSLINEVVTKGLNPDVQMEDSGVKWIGEIPSHWETPKLKYLVEIGNGKSFSEIEVEKGGYPVLGTGGEFSRCSDYLHEGPSVLLGRKGTIDKPQIVFEPFWTSDTLYYTVIGEDVLPKLLYHLVCQIPFSLYSYGSAIPSMTKTDYEEMKFPIPPISEQKIILKCIDSETQTIDKTVSLEEKKINLLKEYKQSLISEVVTGKVNVQEEVLV